MLMRFAPMLAVGCWTAPAPATTPRPPALAAICTASSLLLPATEVAHEPRLGRPVIRLPDGRALIHEADGVGYLWDPETRELTDVGAIALEPAGALGHFIRRGKSTVLHDVDPDRSRPGLRPVWTPHEHTPLARITGVLDGVPVSIRRDAGELVVTCVGGADAITEHRFGAPPDLEVARSADALAGHRLLMHGPHRVDRSIELFVLDLDARRVRSIGRANRRAAPSTAILVPAVRWRRDARRPDGAPSEDRSCQRAYCPEFELVTVVVDPATERIVSTRAERLMSAR